MSHSRSPEVRILADAWLTWTDEQLEQMLFQAEPGSHNHEKAKYLLEKRQREREMARKAQITKTISPSLEPDKGIRVLRNHIAKGKELLKIRPLVMDDVHAWVNTGRELLIRCFGSDSKNVSEFAHAGANSWPDNDTPPAWDEVHAKTLGFQLKLLESCIDQLAVDVDSNGGLQDDAAAASLGVGSGIFLVHGQNDGVRELVARFLEALDLDVIILQEQADKGRTVIEKFIDHAGEVGFAVVLLTADDKGGPRNGKFEDQRFRARQNVWLELGYFMGKLGRPRVCAVYEEGVEIPSDYRGVLFISLDGEGAWKLKLAKEIRAAGIAVDLNKLD
jgi:predicted nucleotide-binding protein